MNISEVLSGDTKKEIYKKTRRRRKKKKKEKLSLNDIKSLMSARSYYRGPGGAMRQK